ncbi:MAG TPA: hypothetical protein DCE76_02860 [Anaerolineaceae bacterium]|jgi:hypothetical protein|nr:hypothetical protein [Anaerolineaceae bacterium]
MTRDLRRYARQTTIRLIIGAILLIFLVGGGLILYFYGSGALAMGILCFITGLTPVVLIVLILTLLEWIVKRERNN